MAMENGGLSPSDVALLNNNGFGDGGAFMWIFALLILANGGFGGGFGNNGNSNAIQNDINRGFDNQNLQAQTRDILSAVTNGTAQSVAATNQTFHDNLAAMQSLYNETTRDIAGLAVGQANMLANQNACCCEQKQMIMQSNYDAAMRDAVTNANFTRQIQEVKDIMAGNRMADMQNEINGLQLQNAMAGVVRYPNAWTYNAGMSPFCGCNYGCGCGM